MNVELDRNFCTPEQHIQKWREAFKTIGVSDVSLQMCCWTSADHTEPSIDYGARIKALEKIRLSEGRKEGRESHMNPAIHDAELWMQ